jgi:hypothetical protein
MRQAALLTTVATLATLATLAALVGGCAATTAKPKPQPVPAPPAARGVECHSERITGTLIAATVCTTPAERARQADNTEQTRDWMSKPKGGACPPTMACN